MSLVCKEKRLSHLHLKDNSQFKSVIHQQFLSVICGAKLKIQYWHEELFFAGVKCWFTIWILADSEACQVLEGMYFPLIFLEEDRSQLGHILFTGGPPCRVIRSKAKYNYNITFFQVIVMIKPLLLSPEKVCDSVNPSIRHPTKNSFKYIYFTPERTSALFWVCCDRANILYFKVSQNSNISVRC